MYNILIVGEKKLEIVSLNCDAQPVDSVTQSLFPQTISGSQI